MHLHVTSLEVESNGTVAVVVHAYSPHIRLVKTRDIKAVTRPGETYTAEGGNWYEHRSE